LGGESGDREGEWRRDLHAGSPQVPSQGFDEDSGLEETSGINVSSLASNSKNSALSSSDEPGVFSAARSKDVIRSGGGGMSKGLSAADEMEEDGRDGDLDGLALGATEVLAAEDIIEEDDGRDEDLDGLTIARGDSGGESLPEDVGKTGFAIDRLRFFGQYFNLIHRYLPLLRIFRQTLIKMDLTRRV
jgi:hypothetical protein